MENNFNEEVLPCIDLCIKKIECLSDYYIGIQKHRDKICNLLEKSGRLYNPKIKDNFFNNLNNYIEELNKSIDIIKEVYSDLQNKSTDNIQFKNLLRNEFVHYNWNISYTDVYYIGMFKRCNEKLDADIDFNNDDFAILDMYTWLIESSYSILDELLHKVSSINMFNRIKEFKNNIVIIGPNGSGKSTLARNLRGKLGDEFAIISAQHLLVYNNPDTKSLSRSEIELVRSFQQIDKLGSDINLSEVFKNDFTNLVMALFEEKSEREREYYSGTEEKRKSILDKTINIWERLIDHRKIINHKQYQLQVKTLEGYSYEFNNLSDGEKAIFYYIGHILLAKKNSYIIIDEPENHLHLSICTKLWDILENEREDCTFIYITHNIDFAVSRNNKTLLWNKNFIPPYDWSFEKIESDIMIPDTLLLQIVGSRKNVLFCEGDDRNSLDYKIYTHLFPNYNVVPVQGHNNVIEYCKSFNRNTKLSGIDAYGIIDGDAWSDEEIESFKNDKIMVLPYNEIENFLCESKILEKIIKITGGEATNLEEYKNKFFAKVSKMKENQAVWFANNSINNYLKHNMFTENKNIEKLKQEVLSFLSSEKITEYYEMRISELDEYIESKNYNKLIRIVNLKKALTCELANKFIVNNYEGRVINLIRNDKKFLKFLKEEYICRYFDLL